MYSVTLQSVILKTLLNHFILKHFENDSKVFLKWVVGKDWLKKKQFELSYFKFYLKGVQNALKIFYKSLKNLAQKFATICIWKLSTFGFELELSLISKQNLKRKGLSWFQKWISKRCLPKWFEKVILFDLIPQKSYSKKNLNMCIKSFVDFKRKWELKTYSLHF